MFGLNKASIIGNVGSNPELRYTPSGRPVASFTVATNRRYEKNGERVEETTWFSVVVWNKLAESCNQFVAKGQLVFASGRINLNKWVSSDGQQKSRLELHAQNVIFLSRANQEAVSEEVEPLDMGEPEDLPF